MSEPDCGCRVNVTVSLPPGAASYTTTFLFCPLHKAAPNLLLQLETATLFIEGAFPKPSPILKRELDNLHRAIDKAKLTTS